MKKYAIPRLTLFSLILCCAMAMAVAADSALAATKMDWKVLSSQMRVGKNKQGRITDHQVRCTLQYTNRSDNDRRIVRIYDRQIWFTGVIEVIVPPDKVAGTNFNISGTGGRQTINFKYTEKFPQDLQTDIFPGSSMKRVYFFWLKADRVIKNYNPNYTYRLKSLNVVKHSYKYRTEEI